MATKQMPFSGVVLDLGIADKNQLELFNAVGRTKGPFQGVIDWPYLNGVVAARSSELLLSKGEDTWRDAGGVYGGDGKPTFALRSSCAAEIVQGIAADLGGFIWTDTQGVGWAVSLVPMMGREPHTYAGLAISWHGGGRLIDPVAREEYRRAVAQQISELEPGSEADTRRQLQKIADGMWLYERGEQMLWAIHAAVLMQRRSVVLLPDVSLAEIVWGGNRASWPDNWRNTLTDIIWSLNQLHVATVRIGGAGWRPAFEMRSVAVASYENVERNRRRRDVCRPSCPLWNRPERHEHLLIQIGYGFLGLLERFAISDDQDGARQFDFDQKKPAGEAGKAIGAARERGQIVPVHLPTRVFGPAEWSKLTRGQLGIIQGLVREVTRVKKKSETTRRDKAAVVIGNHVPDGRGRNQVICPFLRPDERHVSFNGNGLRRGQGYLIVGRRNVGWLAKCGYVAPGAAQKWSGRGGLGGVTRAFLQDLAEVSFLLGLTVVGLAKRTGEWLSLKRITEVAEIRNAWRSLNEIHVRVYGPEDYLDRCRRLLAERGQFSIIPGGEATEIAPESKVPLADANLELKVRLRRAGISQQNLAHHLGIGTSFVSELLNGKKRWPAGMRDRAEAFLGGSK